MPFFKLSLNLPKKKLFRDQTQDNKADEKDDVLSTVSLYELLEKFNGQAVPTATSDDESATSTYGLTKLPKYLILHIKRFSQNNYTIEKNGTIVSFPLKNLDMRAYMTEAAKAMVPSVAALGAMSNSELKKIALGSVKKEIVQGIVERPELIRLVTGIVSNCTKYDLVGNVGHKEEQM